MVKKIVRVIPIVIVLALVMSVVAPTQVQAKKKRDESKKTIKVLMVGNSHSHYASLYLYDIFRTCGYDDIIVGFCMRGGKDLRFIYDSIVNDNADVTYAKNTDDDWYKVEEKKNATVREALSDEKWDYVFIQNSILGQTSRESYYLDAPVGVPSEVVEKSNVTFIPKLLIDEIKQYCPSTKMGWSMMHASEESANKDEKYNGSSDELYKDIVGSTQTIIYSKNLFDTYAWTGPVMEKMKHSYLEPYCLDNENRHAAPGFPRYAMGMCIAKACGADVSQITRANIEGHRFSPYHFKTINRFIEEAYVNPWNTDFANPELKTNLDSPDITSIQVLNEDVQIDWQDVGAVRYVIKYQNKRGRWKSIARVKDATYTFKKNKLRKIRKYKIVAWGDEILKRKTGNSIYLYFKADKRHKRDEKTEQAEQNQPAFFT